VGFETTAATRDDDDDGDDDEAGPAVVVVVPVDPPREGRRTGSDVQAFPSAICVGHRLSIRRPRGISGPWGGGVVITVVVIIVVVVVVPPWAIETTVSTTKAAAAAVAMPCLVGLGEGGDGPAAATQSGPMRIARR
jgi:hypothetical protein